HGRAEGDVETLDAGLAELADAVDDFGGGADQVAGGLLVGAILDLVAVFLDGFSAGGLAGRHVEAQVKRARDLGRAATLFLAPLVQHPTLVGVGFRADVGHVPAVGVTRSNPQGALLASAPDPERHPLPQRSGIHVGVGKLHVLALIVGNLV